MITAWFCNGLRLKLLAGSLGYRLSLWRSTQVTLCGEFGIGATPAGSGMVAIRVFLMRRLGVSPGTTLSMMATDAAMDVAVFVLVVPFALWAIIQEESGIPAGLGRSLLLLAIIVIAGVLAVWAWRRSDRRLDRISSTPFSRLPRWRRRLRARRRLLRRRFAHSVQEFRIGLRTLLKLRRPTLVAVFLVAIVQWSCRYGVLPVLLWGLGHPVSPLPLFVLQGLLFMLALALVVPGGSGGVELAFAVVMAPVIPKELLGVVVLWRFFTYHLYILGGGLLFALVPFTFPRKKITPISSVSGKG
ncbi:MAG TPA: flippase-like domain-containing protein [Firmicutes bacterium]|nr:flippase-like domain-containing protein [Bacillota bacterium]